MLELATGAKARRIGSHERKGTRFVARVLRQMKAHPSDLLPFRGSRLQKFIQSTCLFDGTQNPRIQALPDQFEGLFREIFATHHRWGGQHPVGIVRWRWGLNLGGLGIIGEMA